MKTKKCKLVFMMLFFLVLFVLNNKSYGYGIKFVGFVNKNGENTTALIRSISQTYGTPIGGYKDVDTYGIYPYNWMDMSSVSYHRPSTDSSFETYAIWFHSEPLTNYESSGSENESMGYDYTDGWINVDSLESDRPSDTRENLIHTSISYVKKKDTSSVVKVSQPRNNEDFRIYRETYGNIRNTHETFTVSDWKISNKVLKKIIEENRNSSGKLLKTLDGRTNVVYFSLPIQTASYEWNTSYDAVTNLHEKGWAPGNIGIYRDFGATTPNATIGTSMVNLYDNLVQLPKIDDIAQEVYIRHVDEKGDLIEGIANESEILINSDSKESIISNMGSTDSSFQEYYKISIDNKLKVSRSLVIASNSEVYRYKEANMVTAKTLEEAKKINGNNNTSSLTVETNKTDSKCVTIITFKYEKVPSTPEEEKPEGKIKTLMSNDSIDSCLMVYTPTGVSIKPYLKARKFKIKNLKYKLVQKADKVQYSINTFTVDKLVSGTIDNNPDEGETGRIFGDENSRWTLFNGVAPEEFQVNNVNIENELNEYMSNYSNKLPTKNEFDSYILSNSNMTRESDFDKTFLIPDNRYNGLRIPKISVNYMEYNALSGGNGIKTTDSVSNKLKVLVYNPVSIESPSVSSNGVVNHSTSSENESVIQSNADFELNINNSVGVTYLNHNDYDFLECYYLIFDVDIIKTDKTAYRHIYTVSGDALAEISINESDVIPKGSLIEIDRSTTSFKAKSGPNDNNQSETNILLIGMSKNMPGDILRNIVLKTESDNLLHRINKETFDITNSNNSFTISGSVRNIIKNYCDPDTDISKYKVHDSTYYNGINMYGDAYYFVKASKKATNIGRIYDFKITDCSDIDFKSVFRKSEDLNSVNDLTGIQYFSGSKWFNMYTSEVNTLEERDNISISGTGAKTIIPLGPYKSTNISYIKAPKIGYRISFDVKTSGFYTYSSEENATTRQINITPSYFFISKDGTKFVDNINVYYKNSEGKYINFKGSDYTIYFKPNDGYRYVSNGRIVDNTSNMSTKLEGLVIGSNNGFVLNNNMMSSNENNFIQAWYGEFKLPNSSIAIEGNNISKPLNDGYIGVIFNIECIDNQGKDSEKRISYNVDNKSADPSTNTTQWDYEGFLSFSDPGNTAQNLTLQLEKGTFNIDNNTYNKIKGCVVLFDVDNRAANDFD